MKEFKWKENILVIILVVLVISGAGYRLISSWKAEKGDYFTLQTSGLSSEGEEVGKTGDGKVNESDGGVTFPEEVKDPLVIHIVGAVKNPGVYTLLEGDRVLEAVEKAGGFLEDALSESVNLAARIHDGQQVYIPREGEEVPPAVLQANHAQKININVAAQTDLEKLPGIGPAKAGAIIQDREKNGLFKSIDEITRVTGIGEKTLEGIRDLITI